MAANSSGASVYAKHPTIANLYLGITDSTSTIGVDPITFCLFRNLSSPDVLDTTANTYHHGCIAQVVDDATGLSVFVNTGTYASPAWTNIGSLPPGDIALPSAEILVGNGSGVAAAVNLSGDGTITNSGALTIVPGAITGAKLVTTKGYFSVAVPTNGTALQSLFGASNPFNGTLTALEIIASDATKGTINVSVNGATVATLIKSGAAGGMTGSAINSIGFVTGGSVNVASAGTDNAVLVATFTTA